MPLSTRMKINTSRFSTRKRSKDSASPTEDTTPTTAAADTNADADTDNGKDMKEKIKSPLGEEVPARPFNLEETIPPENEHRTLVLCFDGTGDQFDDDNSNVVNFFTLLKKDNPDRQLVYYQSGIGTYSVPQVAKPFMARLRRTLDTMIGASLNAHVMGGYEFLMQNYHEGDRICIFGFSRGAYTARALAGMLHKVGLLPRGNHQQVPFAYRMYSRRDEKSWQQSAAFKQAFSVDVDVELLGVWDTVGSVGVIPRRLPFTTSNTHVRYFRHALALDERRVRFMPNFWRRTTESEARLGMQRGTMPKSLGSARSARMEPSDWSKDEKEKEKEKEGSRERPHRQKTLAQMEREYTVDGEYETHVEEVWFAGCHCDVGGGSVKNGTRNSLARIPLRWMVRQCFLLRTGILFHRDLLFSIGLDPETLYPHVLHRPAPLPPSEAARIVAEREGGRRFFTSSPTSSPLASPMGSPTSSRFPTMARGTSLMSRSKSTKPESKSKSQAELDAEREKKCRGKEHHHTKPLLPIRGDFVSEEQEDLMDSLCPAYDQLSISKVWWLLEVIPQKIQRLQRDGSWARRHGLNWGRPRVIPKQEERGVHVHRSVRTRMEAETGVVKPNKVYAPKAKLTIKEPTWVA